LAITKERKEALVQQYREQVQQSGGIILADYRGLRVTQMEQLRRSLREVEGSVSVVKNRLLKLALADMNLAVPDEMLEGPTVVAFCQEEVPPVAKAMTDFAKDNPLAIKGGLLEAAVLSGDQVKTLAKLPSREVLLAYVLGTVNAPATQVAGVVASGIRQVLNVLQAYVDKLEEGGTPAPQSA
jgi:large subunit ribosomal protein L10